MAYYVYIYLDPRKQGRCIYGDYCFLYEPFYVGKGSNYRYKQKMNRNKYFKNKINKIKKSGLKPIIIKLEKNLTEKESFILESKLIKIIGRNDLNKGPLVNFTDGGEGTSGRIVTEDELNKRRKDFTIIEREFEKRGYKLLTTECEYNNSKQKLKFICSKNHKHSIRWNNFKQGQDCKICKDKIRSQKRKKNFLEIQKTFKNRNCHLLIKEKEYTNSKQKLDYICQYGQKHSTTWNNFQRGKDCLCYRKRITNFDDIKIEFEKNKCSLLTKEDNYKNNKQKLDYICKNNHKHKISWNSFQQGHRCSCRGIQNDN